MSKKYVITIARQYGSGGRMVGMQLAEELGIKAYSREILKLASEDSGINESLFAQVDEQLKNSRLFGIMKRAYHGELIPPESKDFTSNRNLFNYQAKVIKELAEEESCIIIGRCGDFILKDHPNVVRVFVHAPHDFCLEKVKEFKVYPPTEDPDKYMQKIDKYRADYYNYYTGQIWNDALNYDLCLDSEKLGFDGCAKAIKAYLNIRFGE